MQLCIASARSTPKPDLISFGAVHARAGEGSPAIRMIGRHYRGGSHFLVHHFLLDAILPRFALRGPWSGSAGPPHPYLPPSQFSRLTGFSGHFVFARKINILDLLCGAGPVGQGNRQVYRANIGGERA